MKKLVTRLAVAAALTAFAVPTLACEMMKQNTTASTQEKVESKKEAKADKKAEPSKAQAEKKVASADKKS